jgi:peptidoglycan/LPS O-acetylase OafA/YrhL
VSRAKPVPGSRYRGAVHPVSARRLGNRPGLTGLRAVAIALVVARHAGEVSGVSTFDFGFAGVDIFFVLSGFLITSLLVGEHSRTGRISLPQFYLRRALRLLPALTVFLLVALPFVHFFQPAQFRHALLETLGLSAAFLVNIAKTFHWGTVMLPHMWSLGMEEQFYVLWPITLFALLKLRAPRPLILGVALAGALGVVVARFALHAAEVAAPETLFYSPLHADGLLIGCVLGLAYAWRWLPSPESVRRFVSPTVLAAAAVFAVVSVKGAPYASWGVTVGLLFIALAAAVFVYAAIDEHPIFPLRFLVWRPVTYLGEISYALYIWHFPLVFYWPANELSVELRVALSLAFASASYHLVEKPFLRRKPRHTPDTTERDSALGPIVTSAPAEAGASSP